MKQLYSLLLFFAAVLASSRAQVQTIVANNYSPATLITNINGSYYAGSILNVPTNGFATLKTVIPAGNPNWTFLQISTQGASFFYQPLTVSSTYQTTLQPLVIAGPATIQLLQALTGTLPVAPTDYIASLATFDVQPSPFPPNKAVTVGAYSGNVQVTMQISTDLVNWTPAVNGQIYTNSPDARFFRIQMVTNANP